MDDVAIHARGTKISSWQVTRWWDIKYIKCTSIQDDNVKHNDQVDNDKNTQAYKS